MMSRTVSVFLIGALCGVIGAFLFLLHRGEDADKNIIFPDSVGKVVSDYSLSMRRVA
jgi:hypothetical protein